MEIYKTREFNKWAIKESLSDKALIEAVEEMSKGLIDAHLGGQLKKKRVRLSGRGKSGGIRTIIAFQIDEVAIFLYGFKKNEKDNLTESEETALKILAKGLLALNKNQRKERVLEGSLIEARRNL